MASSEGRDHLRYLMLVRLDTETEAIDYSVTLPGVDFFELRAAASWLVENAYAVWAGTGVVITQTGRQLLASDDWRETTAPDD